MWIHAPFTYKQILHCIEEQSQVEEATGAGPKIMDSVPAKVVMNAFFSKFKAIGTQSPLSPREKIRQQGDLFDGTISGETEEMCASILMNNTWQDHVE